jgi:hypothetical protein
MHAFVNEFISSPQLGSMTVARFGASMKCNRENVTAATLQCGDACRSISISFQQPQLGDVVMVHGIAVRLKEMNEVRNYIRNQFGKVVAKKTTSKKRSRKHRSCKCKVCRFRIKQQVYIF